ncbi:enoyl-CoA hydratase/isomerase family protein [Chloroflexota bacterium]
MGLIYIKEDKVVTMTLNRPEALNTFDPETCREFHEALVNFRDDEDAWVAIITGTGEKAFCAGADLKKWVEAIHKEGFRAPPTIMRGMNIYKPLIAAVNGLAYGGGMEVALACDIRVAADHATFGLREVRWSVMPGWGGTQRLPRMVPWAMASQILLTGEPINAQEAYRIGLINEVVPAAELQSCAMKWANKILQNGPLGVWAVKEAMMRGVSMSLDDGLRLEDLMTHQLATTEDALEGNKAFVEKRKPNYKLR